MGKNTELGCEGNGPSYDLAPLVEFPQKMPWMERQHQRMDLEASSKSIVIARDRHALRQLLAITNPEYKF